ncbi:MULTISPECIES: DUF4870 domain-containing protein [Lysinibacillus]|uniref:DUF4870 domain-containing protein n=1 Tax=Lysinibacillus antri TaxID=2498145 RepID=A0A432LB30_9BACI|nr:MULTISPECIES: DUF4870 domain-containing protein [Lysinibacillus]RUL51609.1 DUF4870 domain-containing protein [Lysinibacillus antri]TSI10650.1 DUF4870 domain-containing protein [Lysinibacillus sp. BW-2-10]
MLSNILENNKMISALCYISLLFAPFILPLIVYFIVKDLEVKFHAKRAFLSHLIPTVIGVLLGVFSVIGMFTVSFDGMSGFVILMLVFTIIYFLLTIGLMIWNLMQAVQILKT